MFKYKIGNLTIASSGTTSNELDAAGSYEQADGMMISAPAALTGTVKVQVDHDGDGTFTELHIDGADVTVAAGDSVVIDFPVAWSSMRLVSSGVEAAERVFEVTGIERRH